MAINRDFPHPPLPPSDLEPFSLDLVLQAPNSFFVPCCSLKGGHKHPQIPSICLLRTRVWPSLLPPPPACPKPLVGRQCKGWLLLLEHSVHMPSHPLAQAPPPPPFSKPYPRVPRPVVLKQCVVLSCAPVTLARDSLCIDDRLLVWNTSLLLRLSTLFPHNAFRCESALLCVSCQHLN